MTPSDLVAYYGQLLTMEYYGLPKATGMVKAVVTPAVADLIIPTVRGGFMLGSATGKQLDCLGELVGAQRAVPGFLPGTPAFALPRYADGAAGSYIGLARYDDNPPPNGHWDRYTDSPTSYVMTDGQFAQFIEFLVAVRASNYSLAALDAIFYRFFAKLVTITDNSDMTMTYTHDATNDTSILFAIIDFLKLLPHPSGVAYTVVTV